MAKTGIRNIDVLPMLDRIIRINDNLIMLFGKDLDRYPTRKERRNIAGVIKGQQDKLNKIRSLLVKL